MAFTPSICHPRPGTPDISRPRTPDLRRRAAPLSAPHAPQTQRVVCAANGPAPKAPSAASLVAVSVAGVATAASVLAPVGPALAPPTAQAAEIVVQRQAPASDIALQLSLPSSQAPVLSFLADGELTPEERAKSLMAEYKRRKEEEAAAKAAAAAAAAEEEAKTKAVFEAVKKPEEPAKPAKVERAKAPAPAPKAAEVPVAKKTNKRGGVPLFVSQFGVLALYSGIVAAAFLVPESKWKVVNEKAQQVGETVAPVLEDAWVKGQPVLEQAKVKGQELLVEARPYAIKAYETAKPIAIELYEKAKPLAIKAWQAGLAAITEALDKKDADKPAKVEVEVIAPGAAEKKSAV